MRARLTVVMVAAGLLVGCRPPDDEVVLDAPRLEAPAGVPAATPDTPPDAPPALALSDTGTAAEAASGATTDAAPSCPAGLQIAVPAYVAEGREPTAAESSLDLRRATLEFQLPQVRALVTEALPLGGTGARVDVATATVVLEVPVAPDAALVDAVGALVGDPALVDWCLLPTG